jgi:hypothetical protein
MATAGTEQGKELMRDARDHELGMNRRITRRDFLNGVAIGVGSLTASAYLTGCARQGVADFASPPPGVPNDPPAARLMRCYPVSTRINRVANDDEECSRTKTFGHVETSSSSFFTLFIVQTPSTAFSMPGNDCSIRGLTNAARRIHD